jgi:hypothetical protein
MEAFMSNDNAVRAMKSDFSPVAASRGGDNFLISAFSIGSRCTGW